MTPSSISLISPLADARRNPKTGLKAVNLSKVIAARFAVPRGFAISADAYRYHLWASGVRELANTSSQEAERERLRGAILAQPIPADVSSAVDEAYQRLSWQSGDAEPRVAVRASATEGAPAIGGLPEAYEACLNVAGPHDLKEAIKRVWASLWSENAAAARAKLGITGEPAMGVVVQRMVESDRRGTASTANPITGDPLKVLVSSTRPGRSKPDHHEIDLRDLGSDGPRSADELVRLVAEKAILLEEVFSSRITLDWAHESDRLWVLQAEPMVSLPSYFPVDWPSDAEGKARWDRLTPAPISAFARSHLWQTAHRQTGPLHSKTRPDRGLLINGYVYRRHGELAGAQTEPTPDQALAKELAAGAELLAKWEAKVEPDIRSRAVDLMQSDPSTMDHAQLIRALTKAAQVSLDADEWRERTRRPCALFPKLLGEVAGCGPDGASLFDRLTGGLPDATIMRDARLQELGERFAIAEQAGKLDDANWWRSYRQEVEGVAREYGYSYHSASEMCDVAGWTSWVEDPEAVFRIIGALANRDKRPSLVTLHCAKELDAAEAATEASRAYKGKGLKGFEDLLRLGRGWLPVRNRAEQIHALANTALRLILMELARRLCADGVIVRADDIFHLEMSEIVALPASPDARRHAQVAAKIAQRKHDAWLESRFDAPETLPINDAQAKVDAIGRVEGVFRGAAASPGVATGRVLVARTIADASGIRNGDILVVDSIKLAWTPLLGVAGAIVAESGCECPSESLIAREYGIPSVTNCAGILAAVSEGQRITVDGSRGVVEVRASSRHKDATPAAR